MRPVKLINVLKVFLKTQKEVFDKEEKEEAKKLESWVEYSLIEKLSLIVHLYDLENELGKYQKFVYFQRFDEFFFHCFQGLRKKTA